MWWGRRQGCPNKETHRFIFLYKKIPVVEITDTHEVYIQILHAWALPLQLHSRRRVAQPPCGHRSGQCCPQMGQDAVPGYKSLMAAPKTSGSLGRDAVSLSMLPFLSLAPDHELSHASLPVSSSWCPGSLWRGVSAKLSVPRHDPRLLPAWPPQCPS